MRRLVFTVELVFCGALSAEAAVEALAEAAARAGAGAGAERPWY